MRCGKTRTLGATDDMRRELRQLIDLGTLPSETTASEKDIDVRERLIRAIAPPLTLEEAAALARILGSDNCFGLAWTIVHLVESAPGWSLRSLPKGDSPFLLTLRTRLQNAV
jgi:hypothetical protein